MGNAAQNYRLHGGQGGAVRHLHLTAALAVAVLLAVVLSSGEAYARWMENRYVHTLADRSFIQKNQGSALQSEAFRSPDLLPIYGSSELDLPDRFNANRIFRKYPTGFTTFPIGGNASQPLIILQKLAAVGTDLQGKKVAISLSPGFFLDTMMPPDDYAGNFSPLHANGLAFNMRLSWELRKAAAKRMLDYPDTLRNDRVLNFALERLSDGSQVSRALYLAILPYGKLESWGLELQDDWETLNFIWGADNLDTKLPKEAGELDWTMLLMHGQDHYRQHADNNPFGFDNGQWQQFGKLWLSNKNSLDDQQFLRALRLSSGWTDLELLLREMRELGAETLVLSMPFPGQYFDYMGVSRAARQEYYNRLEALARAYGLSEVDFQDHDQDKYFFWNPGSHLSSVGWVYYSRALDAFYHERGSSSQ